jgi:flagellar hook protein FlgE
MLRSALQSALSGISAAGTAVQVHAHNLANARTDGFKQSRPVFATQSPQTISPGHGPNTTGGGGNPLQTGNGVQVAEIQTDDSPGPLVPDATSPSGVRELSNTDVAGNLIGLSLAENMFRANLAVWRTGDELLDELLHLRRL